MKHDCMMSFQGLFLSYSALEDIWGPVVNGNMQEAKENLHDAQQNFELGIKQLFDEKEASVLIKEFNDVCQDIIAWHASNKNMDIKNIEFKAQQLHNKYEQTVPSRILKMCGCSPS